MQSESLNILVSPLDWGLGHASRSIPVINQLIKTGHKVTIAGSGRSIILLQKEFPNLESIDLQGFSPSFSGSGNPLLHLLFQLPHFIATILLEHCELKKIISLHHFDSIISDNRYGLWNKKVKSILITHQVMIKVPAWLKFAEYPIYLISRLMISRFDECWIPDYEESPGLSGDLSHKYPLPKNARFISPLTRFIESEISSENNAGDRKIVAIISGPEPQRSIFEDLVTSQLTELNIPGILLSGKPESGKQPLIKEKLIILPHLPTDEMNSILKSASLVICRSGYSSIMDLYALGSKALFIPTPGQTEQIYLAELHQKGGSTFWQKQEKMNLKADIDEALKYPGFSNNNIQTSLSAAIADLKKK